MLNSIYIEIKERLLQEMSLEEFSSWKYLDEFGNKCTNVQFADDLRRELEKLERYDLLIDLRDENSF